MCCTFPVSAMWTACATHWLVRLDSAYSNKCWGQVFQITMTAKPITVTIWRCSTVSCCALFFTRRVTNSRTSCKMEHHIVHIPFLACPDNHLPGRWIGRRGPSGFRKVSNLLLTSFCGASQRRDNDHKQEHLTKWRNKFKTICVFRFF